jgi:hypothetical protein
VFYAFGIWQRLASNTEIGTYRYRSGSKFKPQAQPPLQKVANKLSRQTLQRSRRHNGMDIGS